MSLQSDERQQLKYLPHRHQLRRDTGTAAGGQNVRKKQLEETGAILAFEACKHLNNIQVKYRQVWGKCAESIADS